MGPTRLFRLALRAAGQSHPKRLISHVSFANPNADWNVVDIWEPAEPFVEIWQNACSPKNWGKYSTTHGTSGVLCSFRSSRRR